jgi:hypothetical protein
MSNDFPDFALLHSPGDLPQFSGFRHRLVLRPDGVSSRPFLRRQDPFRRRGYVVEVAQ